jgi:hypothetical protein
MRQFDQLKVRILALFPGLIACAEQAGAAESVRRLKSCEAQLAEARLAVVVCGEFKRGKSSLLNALLEEPGLFPVDDYYATSLVSTISHAETEQITVMLTGQNGASDLRSIGRADLASYVTESGNRDNHKGVELVEIRTPNPRLRSGLTFVDTPGVGGVYIRHTMVTLGFLPHAHAVLFVVDATQVLTESELHFLRRAATAAKVTSDTDGLICVLTKIDLVSDYTRLVDNTRAKLSAVMSLPPEAVTIIPVSAKAKLRYLTRRDQRYLKASNFEELDRTIWSTLDRRQAKVVLGSALTELERSAQALLEPIESELAALQAQTDEHAERVRSAQRARKQRLAELDDNGPSWQRDLKAQLAEMTHAVQEVAEAELDDIWRQFRTDYLNRNDFLREPERLVSRLDEDAVAVAGTASKLLSQRAARLQRQFAEQAGFDLGNAQIGSLPDPPVSRLLITDRLQESQAGSSGSTGAGVRGAAAAAGAAAGAAIGTAIAPGIGTVIGGALGALAGFFGSKRAVRSSAPSYAPSAPVQDVPALRRRLEAQIAPLEKVQRRHVSDSVTDVAEEFAALMMAELESRIAQEHESLEDAVRRAEQARAHNADTARVRQQELARDRIPIDYVRAEVGSLADEVMKLSTAPSEQA